MSPICLYSAYAFQRNFVPKHRKIQIVQEATYDWILWDSPVARHLWRECKTILHAIKTPFTCESYYSAVLALDDPNLLHEDEEVKLRAIIKQNLITYSLWTLYTAERKINESKLKGELTDEMIDDWPCDVTAKFQLLVKDEIRMLLFHKKQLDINMKFQVGNKWKSCHSEREKYFIRSSYTFIDINKLSEAHIALYNCIWCCDLVEITNEALVVKPFRREPP